MSPSPSAVVEFLNEEAANAQRLAEDVTPRTLRRLLLAAASGRYAFPLVLTLRGLVVGRRIVAPQAAALPAGVAAPAAPEAPEDGACLEIVPEGLTKEAFDLLGPLLVPSSRALEEGSVVRLEIELPDPSSYEVQPAGLLAPASALRVEVAVER